MLLIDLIWVIERWIGGQGMMMVREYRGEKRGERGGGSVVLGVFPSHPQVSLQPDYVSWKCIAGKQTYLRERVAFQQLVSLP
jgi:hypothetical protein